MATTTLQFDSGKPRLKGECEVCTASSSLLTRVTVCVKESFTFPDGVLLTVRADVDTQTGGVVPHGSLRKVFRISNSPLGLTRIELGSSMRRDRSFAYGVRAHARLDVTEDGMLFLDARFGAAASVASLNCAVQRAYSGSGYTSTPGAAAAARARKAASARSSSGGFDLATAARGFAEAVQPDGYVELSQVVLNFNDKQDIKVSLGYDVGLRQPYFALKENNWEVRRQLLDHL